MAFRPADLLRFVLSRRIYPYKPLLGCGFMPPCGLQDVRLDNGHTHTLRGGTCVWL